MIIKLKVDFQSWF